jgi:uncharacterized protein
MVVRNFYEQFKTPIVTIVILFVALFLYTKFAGPIPFSINSVNTTKTDLFSTDGQGQETAVPDTATVSIGVTQTAANVSDAKDKANKIANKIIEDVKKLGILEKDIKTTNYSVNPNYGNNEIMPMMYPIRDGGNNITGYTVTQNIDIKVKPTDKANTIIDAVTKDGANLVGGVSFTFSDELEKKLEESARKEAVKKAKEKAQSLANASGLRLGRIVNVIENSSFPRYMPMMAGAEKAETPDTIQTNVTPGENTVTINVTIFYETY